MNGDKDTEWETNYINNLGTEIVRECTNMGLHVTQELAVHYIKLKVLNPRNGFFVTRRTSRELTQKFVRSCVNDLMQPTPAIDCIRMQAYWHSVSPKLDEVKHIYNAHLLEKSQSVFEDILNMDESEKLLRKIALFANTYTNIGNGNMSLNIKETTHPLKSVLKQRELEFFISLSKTGKFEYLKYVARLVGGIRIYQHYYKSGSENVDNAPLLLANVSTSVLDVVTKVLAKLSERIKILVKELHCVYQVMPGMIKHEIPAGFDTEDFVHLRHIHHIMMQHEMYLKEIFSHLKNFNKAVHQMTKNVIELVQKLKETIGTREKIPVTEVYDQFTDICDEWSALQTESCYLICVGLIVKNLCMMNKYFPLTGLEVALGLAEKEQRIADERERNRRIVIDTEGKEVDLLIPTDQTALEFHGFCSLTLVTTNGALLPARTELGILKYKNNCYGFSSAEAAEIWRTKPELNIRRAYEVIRRNPQLVHLLNMYDLLYCFRKTDLVTDREDSRQTTQDRIVQTVLHPVCNFLDKDYSFSEWQHKYKALQLSRIVKCVTKSVQTSNRSHFRASIGIQCEPDKTKWSETKKDVGCVHENIRNYIWNLRGTNQFHLLSLTPPIYEPCEKRQANETGKSTSALPNKLVDAMETECVNILGDNNSRYSCDSW